MATENELTRLAAMANALRPDWHPRSVRAVLADRHRNRTYMDLAVVLAALATDPDTTTPGRLDQHGPWWAVTRALVSGGVPDVGPGNRPACELPGHDHEAAGACRLCRAEALTDLPPDRPAPPVPPPTGWRPTIVRDMPRETA